VAVVAAGLAPLLLPASGDIVLSSLAIYFVWVTLAQSWNLAGGFGGLLNLGLVAFFGLGGVIGAVSMTSGAPALLALGLAAASGAGLALILVPTFRLRSYRFAIATFVVPLALKPVLEIASGRTTFSIPLNQIFTPAGLYYSGLLVAGTTTISVILLLRGKAGLALRSLRDDDVASTSVGVNAVFYKSLALVVSGASASAAGFYYLQVIGTVDTTIFQNLTFSLFPIFMVIIGGIGTLEGPILGAAVFSMINYLATAESPGSVIDTLVLSFAIVAIAVLRPEGLASWRAQR